MELINVRNGIKVGGFHYRVEHNAESDRLLRGDNANGQHNGEDQVIRITTDVPEVYKSEIFLHEVIEAINLIYCDRSLEHSEICRLSYGLHQVMESLDLRFTCY